MQREEGGSTAPLWGVEERLPALEQGLQRIQGNSLRHELPAVALLVPGDANELGEGGPCAGTQRHEDIDDRGTHAVVLDVYEAGKDSGGLVCDEVRVFAAGQ